MNPHHLDRKWRGVLATMAPGLSASRERLLRVAFMNGAAAMWDILHSKLDLSTSETTRYDQQLFHDLYEELREEANQAGEINGTGNSY